MDVRELQTVADLEAAQAAHSQAFAAAYEDILPASVIDSVTSPSTTAEVRDRYDTIEDQPGCFLVALLKDRIVGYAWFRWGAPTKEFVGDDEAGLKELYVHPDHWREGVGTALLADGRDRIPDEYSALVLEALADNDVGTKFYEARGFTAVDTFVDHADETPIEHTVYRKPLK